MSYALLSINPYPGNIPSVLDYAKYCIIITCTVTVLLPMRVLHSSCHCYTSGGDDQSPNVVYYSDNSYLSSTIVYCEINLVLPRSPCLPTPRPSKQAETNRQASNDSQAGKRRQNLSHQVRAYSGNQVLTFSFLTYGVTYGAVG